jgi:hypothetical protein
VTGLDTLTWDKPTMDIQPGDSVRWSFAGTTQVHSGMTGAVRVAESAPSPAGAAAEPAVVCQ